MSNLSGLPPAAIARTAMLAQLQDVAVKLILLPESLQNNPQSVTLSGTVKGQTPEGMVQIETDRGILNILLKDRGNLPVGQKIEIEIPAGRPPQQAAIRPETHPTSQPTATQPAPSSPPSLASMINSSVKLDRGQTIKPDDIAEALSTIQPGQEIRIAAPLQAGQILRLIPISTMPQASGNVSNIANLSPEQLFSSLMNMISEAVDIPLETKRNLAQILGRIDLSTLLPQSGEDSALPIQTQLTTAFQKLTQSLDLPSSLKLQNAALQNTPIPVFNSSKPLDVQIVAFQNGSFQAALTQAQTSGTPQLNLQNFSILPQPPILAAPSQTPVTPQTQGVPIPQAAPQTVLPTQLSVISPTPVQATEFPETQQSVQPVVTTPISQPAQPAAPLQTAIPVTMPQAQNTPSQPATILGKVINFTPQGQPIVSLALPGSPVPQNYAVQFIANNIIEGAPIIVSPLPSAAPQPQAGIVPFAIGTNQSLASWAQPETWDSLQTLISTVAHLNPGMAQSMINILPHANAPQNMGALATLFLSMMRSGELDNWVSQPAINLLKQSGKIDVLRALAGESVMTNRLDAAPLPNEWRATIFPFWHDQQIHKLPVYYKHWENEKSEEDERAERRKKMRFMFELKLSRMGPVQVDGFMQQKKLDMILRTKSMISLPMQEALRKTYHNSMERSDLSGEITFQFKPEQWVHVEMPMETFG